MITDSNWVTVNSINKDGETFSFTDQAIWADPIAEFNLSWKSTQESTATLFVLPQENGCLITGTITGTISVPCNRCAEESILNIQHKVQTFEVFPNSFTSENKGTHQEECEDTEDADADENVIRVTPNGYEINFHALLWEEFSLAMPVKPLCQKECKGVCSQCGCNKNTQQCSCTQTEGDPRMAVLKNLIVEKKN